MENSRLTEEIKEIIKNNFPDDETTEKFLDKLEQGSLTIDENPKSHFCIYFAAYDPKAREIFIGHHKKSGLWLFNGGHIDKGETLKETLKREISEEWGLNSDDFKIKPPAFLEITEINNPAKQPCNTHYDLWHFISVDKNTFNPDNDKLAEEFYEIGWKNMEEARNLIKDKNTLIGIDFTENNFFK